MKLHTTAAVALLASTLALGGCGDPAEQAAPAATAPAPSIDDSNCLDAADRQGLTRAKVPSITNGDYHPGWERRRAHDSRTQDHRHTVDRGLGLPDDTHRSGSFRASDHGTQDRIRIVE